MSLGRTLTATVAALYLGMGSAGAEEPKPQERQLRCTKEWNDLLSIVSSDGEDKKHYHFVVSSDPDDGAYSQREIKLQLDKSNSVVVSLREDNSAVMRVIKSNQFKTSDQSFLTNSHPLDSGYHHLCDVFVSECRVGNYCSGDEDLDLSNPTIRQTAERKFCGYVKQAAAKYEKDNRQVKDDKVQKQLELLK